MLPGSSQPKDWTWVSCIAGRFITIRATREASICILHTLCWLLRFAVKSSLRIIPKFNIQFSFFFSSCYFIHTWSAGSSTYDVVWVSLCGANSMYFIGQLYFFIALPVYLWNKFLSPLFLKNLPITSALIIFSWFPAPSAESVPYNVVLSCLYFVWCWVSMLVLYIWDGAIGTHMRQLQLWSITVRRLGLMLS